MLDDKAAPTCGKRVDETGGPIEFSDASPADDEILRWILRQTPLPGWISLSFEREPSLLAAAALEGEAYRVIVAKDAVSGRIIGFFTRSTRRVFINGEITSVGYLGQLRFDPSYKTVVGAMRRGYAYWRDHVCQPDECRFDLTAILADNWPARRMLEAGVDGLPTYTPFADYSTLAIGVSRYAYDQAIVPGTEERLDAIACFLQQQYRGFQFAPCWTGDDLRRLCTSHGLRPDDFLLAEENGNIIGCVALWDQSACKQTVVRGYARAVRIARPLINIAAPLAGLPPLPPVGDNLRQAFLSHLAIVPGREKDVLPRLMRMARTRARERGCEVVLMGGASPHPYVTSAKSEFRHLEYRSILYLVHWPGTLSAIDRIDRGRLPLMELATL